MRYNFFLDEMIIIHNEELVEQLVRSGQRPDRLSPEHLHKPVKRDGQ
jgi:hypothetical protein